MRSQDGALVICGVDLATARSECSRLTAEARIPIGQHDPSHPEPNRPTAMFLGELVTYEVRPVDGLVVK